MKKLPLKAFIKGSTEPKAGTPGCANYDGDCLFGNCVVLNQSIRCRYFEKAVLPTSDISIRDEYEYITGVQITGLTMNICGDCGKAILPRRRYCDKCKRKRRQATYRKYKQLKAG